jgi:ribonuclease Z
MRVNAWAFLGLVSVLASSAAAQTPQSSASVTVTLLGTGSPTPSAERMGPCTLVEAGSERLLFDAGRGCAIRVAQARYPMARANEGLPDALACRSHVRVA